MILNIVYIMFLYIICIIYNTYNENINIFIEYFWGIFLEFKINKKII